MSPGKQLELTKLRISCSGGVGLFSSPTSKTHPTIQAPTSRSSVRHTTKRLSHDKFRNTITTMRSPSNLAHGTSHHCTSDLRGLHGTIVSAYILFLSLSLSLSLSLAFSFSAFPLSVPIKVPVKVHSTCETQGQLMHYCVIACRCLTGLGMIRCKYASLGTLHGVGRNHTSNIKQKLLSVP